LISSLNGFIDRIISYKGIDSDTLQFKKIHAISSFLVIAYVVFMTLLALRNEVPSLQLYGILLLGFYVPYLIFFLVLPYRMEWLAHVNQNYIILVTFIIIIRLGGIHNSGGIIFAALSGLMYSIQFQRISWSVWYFSLFAGSTIVASIIQNRFLVPPEMPQQVNHLFFLFNTLFISGITLAQVISSLSRHTRTEKERANKLKELDEIKTRFYTNITHEFRTPLTVILGMTEKMEADPGNTARNELGKIKRNSLSLLHLVNQMLDLSKLEAGAIRIHVTHGDVISYLKMLLESFQSLAEIKGILLDFKSEVESLMMDYDSEKLKQIISNLVTNALKYTPEGGSIMLRASVDYQIQSTLTIEIEDTGIGIAPDKLEHIFERFYRVDAGASTGQDGSGLGLAITRELVKLLGGEIQVSSEVNRGTRFVLILPVLKDAVLFGPEEGRMSVELDDLKVVTGENLQELPFSKDELPIMLIVEDNADVRDYLHSILEDHYRIHLAENGKLGLEKALNLVPDIVISDIMMPELDGVAMVNQLKNDMRTSHIPVILLTAKADMASRLEGLETGAEAYLEKPFHKEELFVILRKLIESRRKLRERYATFMLPEPAKDKLFRNEDSFMSRVHDTFRENLGDDTLGIEQLCEILGMSRSQLYRKFKAITSQSIRDYLYTFRLYVAKQLLLESDLNVTQVSNEVGFKDLSHFSHRFYEEYGLNPSEIKKKLS
jgi:signal transduction histidine kinase/CheY-like chemotaxis protein/AraC-like DNA-binding protein